MKFQNAYDSVTKEVLYNILIELGIPMKLERIIKILMIAVYSRNRLGKYCLKSCFLLRTVTQLYYL
jgi:hypothetical protein